LTKSERDCLISPTWENVISYFSYHDTIQRSTYQGRLLAIAMLCACSHRLSSTRFLQRCDPEWVRRTPTAKHQSSEWNSAQWSTSNGHHADQGLLTWTRGLEWTRTAEKLKGKKPPSSSEDEKQQDHFYRLLLIYGFSGQYEAINSYWVLPPGCVLHYC